MREPRSMRRLPYRAVIALLVAVLGFALATQVRTASTAQGALAGARQEDLVRILADLQARSERLQGELADLRATRERLTSGSNRAAAALEEARRREKTLGVLAGTLPATGPGVLLTITDPRGTVPADLLLDALEELRDAGAEAVQLGQVRVVASTALLDADDGVSVDGTVVRSPYVFTVIGDPRTLASAMSIPGGVLDAVQRNAGATATVDQRTKVTVAALRALETPRYARPAS